MHETTTVRQSTKSRLSENLRETPHQVGSCVSRLSDQAKSEPTDIYQQPTITATLYKYRG